MPEQLPLFARRARRRDPLSSKIAAGQAVQFDQAHYAKLLASRGGTIYEMADETGLDAVAIARRMPELQDYGRARATEVHRPSPSGRPCRVWEILPVTPSRVKR